MVDFLLLPLLQGYLLLRDYLLLRQDFPLCHPDSLLQGAQKGCSMGLGGFVLLLLWVVPILRPLLFQLRRIWELLREVVPE